MDLERVAGMLDKTFAFAINRTFSREEAEELAQEIMLQALKGLETIEDQTKFEAWFWRLADITFKVFKRGKARIRNCFSFNDVSAPLYEDEYTFIQDEEYQNLRRQIASLSASYREIVILHYYDNLTCREIAQSLSMPEGTVTYRLSMARNKLKKECSIMTESALKPMKLEISMSGGGDYNGVDRPFPWQYINDSLSQNILWYAYREPKTVGDLSKLTGVPAFYLEERIQNLINREAVIQPTKNTVQTDFLIFDGQASAYGQAHASEFARSVSEGFFDAAKELTKKR